jgi:hypothetical protein
MANINAASADIFFKLRNRFPKIHMGNESGAPTVDPEEARFFNFTYTDKISKRPYGNVTVSVIDNNSLKVYFDTSITETMLDEDKQYWFEFLKELRRLAKSHMLNLDVRDITKDVLSRQDLEYMTKQNPDKKSVTESKVLWHRRGKVSEGNLHNVRIHVVHSDKMIENTNNRLLKVDRIYLVNEDGEKFLLPFKSVGGAKAMANYVSRGGNPYDNTGNLIKTAVQEMRNLSRFVQSTKNRTFEAAEVPAVIEAAGKMKDSIRTSLMRLSNNSRQWDESIESLSRLLGETETDTDSMKAWFTQNTYNEQLDTYLPSAAMAYKRLQENMLEAAGAVEKKIQDPNFKLVLKADPAMDKLLTNRKYSDNTAMVSAILGDIANRMVGADGDDVANFAAHMGDMIASEGEPFGQKRDPEYIRDKKLAILLAQKYLKDLQMMKTDPEYAASVRVDPSEKPRIKMKKTREGDQFESEIMGMGEAKESDEPVNKDDDDDDWRDITGKKDPEGAYKGKKGKYHPERDDTKGKPEPWNEGAEKDDTMSEELKRLAKLAGLNESYVYADEAESDEPEADEEQVDSHTDSDTSSVDDKDKGEYDDEAGMAKDQLTHAERAAKELKDLLQSDENLPEWVQAKITKAADYLDMAYDTMDSRHEQGEVKTNEALKGNQEKLDKNHNKKIDAEDFKIMRKDHTNEAKGKKPDFLDMDGDGDEEEPMSKAIKDKKDKEVKENLAWMQAVAGIRTR